MQGHGTVVGKMAPEFKLLDETGEPRELSELIADKPLLLAFYPGDFTPVCTKQLCNYRDSLSDFDGLGIRVVGVSKNDIVSHKRFKERYQIPFALLYDPKNLVARAYGCQSRLIFGMVSRAVFIINQGGVILYQYVEPTPLTRRNSDELVTIVKALQDKGLLNR